MELKDKIAIGVAAGILFQELITDEYLDIDVREDEIVYFIAEQVEEYISNNSWASISGAVLAIEPILINKYGSDQGKQMLIYREF